MDPITLTSQHADGTTLQATFDPSQGMNLTSFSKDGVEFIHNGQGPIIGPHLGERPSFMYPGKDKDPFTNGIARFVPWKTEINENTIQATLDSKDNWENNPISFHEGQSFKMYYQVTLNTKGLQLEMSVVSDNDSIIGMDAKWQLPEGKNYLISSVAPQFLIGKERTLINEHFPSNLDNVITIPLNNHEIHYTFTPHPNPLNGLIQLKTDNYALHINYNAPSQENSWRLIKEKDSSFVTIQALSTQDPYHPNLTVSRIFIQLEPQ